MRCEMTQTESNISIVIVAHNQAELLEKNLPQFLRVAKETNSEVIVVDDYSTDETADLLNRMKEENSELYTTFMPDTVMNKSRMQLSLTIGVKAAHHARIVLANIANPPINNDWVLGLMSGEVALVFKGTKNRQGEVTVKFRYFDSFADVIPMIRLRERRSEKRSSWGMMKILCGEYDAIGVNKEQVFDAIRAFDKPIHSLSLMMLRLEVLMRNCLRIAN